MTRPYLVLAALAVLVLPASLPAAAKDAPPAPLWLRYPAISPDAQHVVFSYGGDLYLVPSAGGEALHLTQHPAHDFMPVWSPDGSSVAFASDRFGNFDLFLIPRSGGESTRLTVHSADDFPSGFHPDGGTLLFSSTRLDSQKCIGFPSGSQPELYAVPVDGTRPVQVLTTPAEAAVYNADATRIAYHDRKGYENIWRKHHTSSIARDIWIFDTTSGKHRKLTDFPGEDRHPVFGKDGVLHYLSEMNGTFNVWKDTKGGPKRLTSFEHHPVRFLSAARDGTLCFGYHGEIFTLAPKPGAKPRKVAITIRTGSKNSERQIVPVNGDATDVALSPNGKELAFITRGEIFVTSLAHDSTKRITNTPEQERSVSFSPDGRSLLYAGERDGSWNLYRSTIAREGEKYFHLATVIQEEPVLETADETFQPKFSPDGKEVAFLEDRTTLRILNLDTGKIRTVLQGDRNYSYSDGDQFFEWSPDSRWLLSGFLGYNRWSEDIALVPARDANAAAGNGAAIVNLTESAYYDSNPQWALGGEAMVWFSNRHGMRAHGSWGSQADAYALFFTRDAYDRFRLSREEYALLKEERKKGDADEDKKGEGDDAEARLTEPVAIEWDGLEDRKVRLTIHSSKLGGAVLSPEGDALYYLSKFEQGYDLWTHKFYEEETKLLTKFPKADDDRRQRKPRKLLMDRKGETLVVLDNGQLYRIDPKKPESKKRIETRSEMEIRHAQEREYMFEHAWRQLKEKFYVRDLHGVDWDFYREEYAKFLPHITNNEDFAEMLSEMLGELNASHTGSGHRPNDKGGDRTASLGIFPDPAHQGPGIRILEVIAKGPLQHAESKARPGVLIEEIDGTPIPAGMNYFPLLNRKEGERTLLAFRDPQTGEQWEEVIKPVSLREEGKLLYERWIKSRAEETERLSGGRVGYVHIRSMNDEGFRKTYDRVLGPENDKDALVVDTRFNGGGWLHDDLVTFLDGKHYLQFFPRGQGNLGGEPMSKWTKPSAVLIGESNYSDAHMFPYAYKAHGVGKLVGMPVPGTATAVWWETLIDPTVYFGIPQVGMRTPDGTLLENTQLEPDLKVPNRPEPTAKGRDKQLEAAVKLLLRE